MRSRVARKIFKCCDEANDTFVMFCDLMRGIINESSSSSKLRQLIERSKLNKIEVLPYYRHNSFQFTKAEHTIEKRRRKRNRKLNINIKEIKDE